MVVQQFQTAVDIGMDAEVTQKIALRFVNRTPQCHLLFWVNQPKRKSRYGARFWSGGEFHRRFRRHAYTGLTAIASHPSS